jgi:hypothetical protein
METIALATKRLRYGAAIACLAAPALAAADSLAVWAIGLPNGYIVMEHQAKVIEVTREHVAQGFVPVAAGTRIVVATRAGGDYALHFAPRGRLFRSVKIEGIGSAVELGAQGGTLTERDAPAGKSTIALNYRFQLAPGTAPGTYPWPLEVVARSARQEGFVASSPAGELLTAGARAPR